MSNSRDEKPSSSQVPTLFTVEISVSKYKEIVERLSIEMFHTHNGMTTVNEEIAKLTTKNALLNKRNEQLELDIVCVKTLKQKITYLKNKLVCAEPIEFALREQVANNELTLKAYKNSSNLVKAYHDKSQVLTMILSNIWKIKLILMRKRL